MLKIISYVISTKFRNVFIKVFSLTSFNDKMIPKDNQGQMAKRGLDELS